MCRVFNGKQIENLYYFKVNEEDGNNYSHLFHFIYFIENMLLVVNIYFVFLHIIYTYSQLCQG